MLVFPCSAFAQTSRGDSLDLVLDTRGTNAGPAGFLQADSPDFELDTRGVDEGATGFLLADSADFILDTTGIDTGAAGVLLADSSDFILDTRGPDSGAAGVLLADSADFTVDTTGPDAGVAGVMLADSADFIVDTRGPDTGGGVLLADSPDFILDTRDVIPVPEIAVEQPAGTDLPDGTTNIDFGNLMVGSSSTAKTFTITNHGTADLTGLEITTDGSHPGDFAAGPLGATTLAPGTSTTFTVTFTATATGPRSAVLLIASNDFDENPFDIGISGEGGAEGDVDRGFDPSLNERVHCTAVQPDGKIVVGGAFTTIGGVASRFLERLNENGTPDTSFNPDVTGPVFCMAVEPDGKIVIGGNFTSIGGVVRNRIARLHADGTLDTSFDPVSDHSVTSMALQPDGKIIIGGVFTEVGGIARNKIARLHPDGTLDLSFTPLPNQYVATIARQPDGKIIIGGSFTKIGEVTRNHIARLHADGTLDQSFDPDSSNIVWCSAVQPDSKIVIGGYFASVGGVPRNFIARLNPDGSPEPGFAPNMNAPVFQTPLQADGKIVIGGYFTSVDETPRNHIARLHADGTLDAGFDPDVDGDVWSSMLQADGMVVIGGTFTMVGGVARKHIARLLNGPATQALTVPSAARVEWLRGGTAPEATQADFELSTDGTTWTALGVGTRISGGWELAGLSLPGSGTIRARGRTTGGDYNGSSGLVEQQAAFSGLPPVFPEIAVEQPAGTDLLDGSASIGCGSVLAGASAAAKTFTIINRGETGLTGLSITKDGSHSGEFRVVGPVTTTLAAGASTTFTVTFTPAAFGTRSAALHIASNDADESPFDIDLEGTGLTALQAWRLENFGTTENTGDAADAADTDHDGVCNLIEFAFGIDPDAPSTHLVPRWQQIGNDLTCSFTRPSGVPGVAYGAEWSPSMAAGSWLPLTNTGAGNEITYSLPIDSSLKKFARLKVLLLDDDGGYVESSEPWYFEFENGVPVKLVWQTEIGQTYGLMVSGDLMTWTRAVGFPKTAEDASIDYLLAPGALGFFRIVPLSEDFVLIPAGTFQMGDSFGEGDSDELPVHGVSVSAFYMAKHEVTKALWDAVRTWGISNGYADLPTGSGKAANHPVQTIPWFSTAKWCNARSEMEGLTPCYTVSGAVYRNGSSAPDCNWSANGYRLPTAAEWERAARGGVSGRRYPWGDTISHSEANYYASGTAYGNLSGNAGYHPAVSDGVTPHTAPVGSFAPNAYGLHELAGNVSEWCWDRYSSDYYSASPGSDPRGPASGSGRLRRGGSWSTGAAADCRVANQSNNYPSHAIDYVGFRLARSSTP